MLDYSNESATFGKSEEHDKGSKEMAPYIEEQTMNINKQCGY